MHHTPAVAHETSEIAATVEHSRAEAVSNLSGERARLARDLHEAAGQHRSLIAAQAPAALRAVDSRPGYRYGRSGGDPMRVVLADDSLLLREGLARLLTEAGFHIVGQVADAAELLELVATERPRVAIMDIRMPSHTDDGIHAAREIRARYPGVGVLVLSHYARLSYACELLNDGAEGVGYLLKDRIDTLADLAEAVSRIGNGGSVLDPVIVSHLVRRPRGDHDPIARLSQREREVLSIMAEGRANQAIAKRLWITERTVEKHVNAIFGKLQMHHSPEDHRRVLAVLAYLRAL